jgi:hypothetical protein
VVGAEGERRDLVPGGGVNPWVGALLSVVRDPRRGEQDIPGEKREDGFSSSFLSAVGSLTCGSGPTYQ